jgi:PHD/YefM family antitoxin component YafN of YafNO toxin-antitoxin module
LANFGETVGLIHNLRNPNILERCLELLAELQRRIKDDGFDREQDAEILDELYGDKGHLRETPRDSYSQWVGTAEVSEEERQREGYATPEECKQNVLDDIQTEIDRLKKYQRTSAAIESDRAKLEILRHNVPDSPGLDRLLKYEASLERAFDRTLSQLERVQRLRRGQPVAPRVDINVAS